VKVGVYVDAFNLYYGGRGHCGRGTKGWRWLDTRALITPMVGWSGAVIDRIIYCTARVDQVDTPNSWVDQDAYIGALLANDSVTHVEEGKYVSWAKKQPLAVDSRERSHPDLFQMTDAIELDPSLPLTVTHDPNLDQDIIYATVRVREEKGSDVNVASHLLKDAFTNEIDAAVVVTNDSDLGLPLAMVRKKIPVGTVNPQNKAVAGALRGKPTDGVGRHWWRTLTPSDFYDHQLPDPVGGFRKPFDW